MKLLLVGNYQPDRQESMLRFGDALEHGMRSRGLEVRQVRPRPKLAGERAAPSGMGKWLGYMDKYIAFRSELREAARWADVIHVVDHSNAPYLHLLDKKRTLLTCNDLLAVRGAIGEFPEYRPRWTGRVQQRWILSSIKLARRVACISHATRDDLLRVAALDPSTVEVVYMGFTHPFSPSTPVAKGGYLLHVGSDAWYKNRRSVLATHAELRLRMKSDAPRLILVGPGLRMPVEGVEVREQVSCAELQALYSGAIALLFPSLYEGFGWPISEAQACGCPVITTRRAPMSEVGGSAAFYLDSPINVEESVAAVRKIMGLTAPQREAIVEQGIRNASRFSLDQMLDGYVTIYDRILRSL